MVAGTGASCSYRGISRWTTVVATVLLLGVSCFADARLALVQAGDPLSFDRDIRPILADKCFRCHGPDQQQRQAELRLDTAAGALGDLGGRRPIVPGKVEESEVWRRITSADVGERMPPPSTGKSLSEAERAALRRWIEQGAEYEPHWSLRPPVKRPPPANQDSSWARTPVDPFVLAGLEREGLTPQGEADRSTLIRRLSLDLLGLPPSPEEVEAFLADRNADPYERLVDRLLASPHFGESFALEWLDAARYADTNGYFVDNERQMWRWRDWVISAFNRNVPFDQFTVEQLAGDLLPQAALEQQVASGFHRNHPVTYETGIVDEEYRVEYVCDRVETTATVWLGLTLGCARCHDHKFDPLSQADFYRVFAFFNNVPETGNAGQAGNADPQIPAPLPEQTLRLETMRRTVDDLAAITDQQKAAAEQAQAEWQREAVGRLPVVAGPLAHVACEADLLDDTLVVWGGEFGRTVYCQGELKPTNFGRDHHGRCFSVWLAGGGIRPGTSYGRTDDYGYNVVENGVHVHDLNATILHCLGIDHTRLTYRFQGRDFRLTDVSGRIVTEVLV
jgi:hypothetical protein